MRHITLPNLYDTKFNCTGKLFTGLGLNIRLSSRTDKSCKSRTFLKNVCQNERQFFLIENIQHKKAL